MKSGKTSVIAAVLFYLISLTAYAAPQPIKTPSDGIIETGEQIAQVRFMLEVYSVIGTGITYHKPRERLTEAMETFEQTLTNLQQMEDPAIRKEAAKCQEDWKPVKKALMSAFEKQDQATMKKEALIVHADIRSVIDDLEKIKDLFLQQAKFAHAPQINAAIEIAASTRSLSSHYMMKMWGVPDPTIDEHWNNAMKKYQAALKELESSPVSKDPVIAPLLKTCDNEYRYFQTISDLGDDFVPVLVEHHAKKIYETADKMVLHLLEMDKKK